LAAPAAAYVRRNAFTRSIARIRVVEPNIVVVVVVVRSLGAARCERSGGWGSQSINHSYARQAYVL